MDYTEPKANKYTGFLSQQVFTSQYKLGANSTQVNNGCKSIIK